MDSISSNKVKNIAKNGRRKSVAYQRDVHPCFIPSSINSVEKIMSKWEGKVDDSLLKTIRHLPNKSLKLNRLPPIVLEELERQHLVSCPQNFGDVVLDFKKNIKQEKSLKSIRITNSKNGASEVGTFSSSDSESQLSDEVEKSLGMGKGSQSVPFKFDQGKV